MCGPVRGAIIGAILNEDWARTPEDASALGERGGEVVCVDGSDRIALRSRTSGEPLGKTAFDVVEWGRGMLTLRCAETGRYLGNLSMQTVIEMDNAGVLKRVRITMAKGIELRKCLYDVRDLDRLIEGSKA